MANNLNNSPKPAVEQEKSINSNNLEKSADGAVDLRKKAVGLDLRRYFEFLRKRIGRLKKSDKEESE
jgi:hypothetical protein